MTSYLKKLLNSESLSQSEAFEAIVRIGQGKINDTQIAAFLFGIQQKNIAVDELIGFREGMLTLANNVDLSEFSPIDVCGTGGDGKNTFNISTTSAFVVAGAGQKVAKHGNHGVSSAVGSSTVLEYLGVKFTNDPAYLKSKINYANMCYFHAPLFHPAMQYVGGVRKALGVKTFFNILGPLLHPAKVTKQLTGVFDLVTFDLYHEFYKKTNTNFGLIHALDGYDEVSLTGDFKYANNSGLRIWSPSDLNFQTIKPAELAGGDSLEDSAKIILNILQNKGTLAQNNAVLANASLAISVGLALNIEDALDLAKQSLESGRAYECFKKLIE